jgi:hypothetical protein
MAERPITDPDHTTIRLRRTTRVGDRPVDLIERTPRTLK